MDEYVKGPTPERWQWTKDYTNYPKWHWIKSCSQYPVEVVQRSSSRPTSDLCDECLDIEKRMQVMRELSRYKEVREIMSREVFTISPESSMAEAAEIMGKKHVGSLIVVEYDVPVGIVTERDLLSKVLALERDLREVKVWAVMSHPLVTIEPGVKIKEAAQLMVHKRGKLTVFEGGKLVGVVTASDLIRSLPEVPETEVKVDDFMTKQVETVDVKTLVATLARMMGTLRIGSVVVTSKGVPFGIFTERDLFSRFLVEGKSLVVEVGKEASSPLITVPVGTSVHQAAVIMTMKHIRRLPITRNGEIAGIITARDLVEAYAK